MVRIYEEYRDKAIELHKKSIVFDAHSDIPLNIALMRQVGETKVFERRHAPKFLAGGVNACGMTVWCDDEQFVFGGFDHPLAVALRVVGYMQHEFEESLGVIMHARSVEEIRQGVKNGKIATLLHLEGGMPLGTNLDYLRLFYTGGVRSIGLTWSVRNLITDGFKERSNSGLSNFGIEMIKEANKLRMIVDVSHLSEKAFFDVLEFSKDPVVATHSNSQSAHESSYPKRNLSDEQIKALAEKGGVMGMNAYPGIVSKEKPSLEKLLDHVDYIRKLVGADHVGIGFDFVDFMGLPKDPYLCPAEPGGCEGLEDTSKVHNFTEGLLSRGYSDQEIRKILGENFLRVYERILGS